MVSGKISYYHHTCACIYITQHKLLFSLIHTHTHSQCTLLHFFFFKRYAADANGNLRRFNRIEMI